MVSPLLFAFSVLPAEAHKPSYANMHTSPESAFEVVDPDISIALYAEMTCTQDTLWMHLDTEGIDEVWLELGVPQLERLENYRPSLAIVAEGLPETDVPFELPDSMGAIVIDTDEVDSPIDFFEPFTQTSSWILFRDWFGVPADTDVYLVAYNPRHYTGKLWVAVGLTEDFSDVGISQFTEWVEKTQAFHEVGDVEEHVELDCSELFDGADPGPAVISDPKGCSAVAVSSRPAGWFGLLLGLTALFARKRETA